MGDRPDGTTRLGIALYGREPLPSEFLGGSEAPMLHDAADRLVELDAEVVRLDKARRRLLEFAKTAHRERIALRTQLAELTESAAMACESPPADCGCAGCRYADERGGAAFEVRE